VCKIATMLNLPDAVSSARPRGGRRFEPVAERALEPDALRAARSLPGARHGLLVLREVAGPFGVPDLVAVVGPSELLRRRCALGVAPLLNEVDAGVVGAAATAAPRSVDSLADRLGWSTQTVERRVPALLRAGALVQRRPGVYTRPADLRPVGRLYALETKVNKWRRAVQQGRTYQLWCDAYIVVMASLGSVTLEALISEAREDGAGVMVAGRWLVRPRVRRRPEHRRLWGSEHVVAAAGAGSEALGATEGLQAVE
jgi:hypothetical protein